MADPKRTDLQRYFETAKTFRRARPRRHRRLAQQLRLDLAGHARGALWGRTGSRRACLPGFAPELRASFQALIHRAPPAPIRYETPLLTREGEERLLSWHQTTLFDHSGEVVGILISART